MEMRKKEFTYRGETIEQLKKLDVREFAKYLNSRQRRTALRQFQEIEKFIDTSKKKIAKNKLIKTHQRALIIVPEMIGMKIHIYNGHSFVPVEIVEEMLGHMFGEFALTRARVKHGSAGIGATKGSRAQAKK
jgi:small subunit ribosomal protein S19